MNLRSFILAGNATFTVTSRKSGTRFTYRVSRAGEGYTSFFASVLSGPDNTDPHSYSYVGMLYAQPDGTCTARQTKGSKVAATAPSWTGFAWLASRLHRQEVIEQHAEVHHMGRCGRCGRALTVPESIESGLGPVCAEKVAA